MLHDVLRTKRRHKREDKFDWLEGNAWDNTYNRDDVLATNWQVEEQEVKISFTQLKTAYENTRLADKDFHYLAAELGFKL